MAENSLAWRRSAPKAQGWLRCSVEPATSHHINVSSGTETPHSVGERLLTVFEARLRSQAHSAMRLHRVTLIEGICTRIPDLPDSNNGNQAQEYHSLGAFFPRGVGELWYVARVRVHGSSLSCWLEKGERIKYHIRLIQNLVGALWVCGLVMPFLIRTFPNGTPISLLMISLILVIGYFGAKPSEPHPHPDQDNSQLRGLSLILYWPFYILEDTHAKRKEWASRVEPAVMDAWHSAIIEIQTTAHPLVGRKTQPQHTANNEPTAATIPSADSVGQDSPFHRKRRF